MGKTRLRLRFVLGALGLVAGLQACGGNSSSPAAPAPTPVPTPTPVSYTGTFAGLMSYNGVSGYYNVQASVQVTHTGNAITLSSVQVSAPFPANYGLGPAVLNGNTFDATNNYNSSGCGVVSSHYTGYFSGDGKIMNLTTTLTSQCGLTDMRGELRR